MGIDNSGSAEMRTGAIFLIWVLSVPTLSICAAQKGQAGPTTMLLAQVEPGTGPYAPGRYGRMCAADPNRCAPQDRPHATDAGPCTDRVGCMQATLDDPFTPPQSRGHCTGMDWNFPWCRHAGCPRNCTGYSTEWRHMRNTFVAYMAVPPDWDTRMRNRVDGAARQCWAEGYRAAGYSTLAAIVVAAASQGVTASQIPAFVIGETQSAITTCLKRESQQLGLTLASYLTPHLEQASGGWTEWQ
jgi:hypothetical protein